MIAHVPHGARIEKLFSRLRSKLEPDPAPPQRLLTARGRGGRLTQGGERCGWLVVGGW